MGPFYFLRVRMIYTCDNFISEVLNFYNSFLFFMEKKITLKAIYDVRCKEKKKGIKGKILKGYTTDF